MKCPHCGGPVLASQRFCGNCGGATSPVSGDVTVATLTPPPVDAASHAPGDLTALPSETSSATDDPAFAATVPPPPPEEALTFEGRRPAARVSVGAATTTLGPGTRFGQRYHLIRLLGEGGMGAVFQAWDEELAVVVAIKVIRPESLKDPAAVRDLERRFKRE